MKIGDLLISKSGNTAICLGTRGQRIGNVFMQHRLPMSVKVYAIKTGKTFWIDAKAYEVINESRNTDKR